MSRWLSNVNSLLEKLDGQAETVAEEAYNKVQDVVDDIDGVGGQQSNIESILEKRGLSISEDDDAVVEEKDDENEKKDHKDDGPSLSSLSPPSPKTTSKDEIAVTKDLPNDNPPLFSEEEQQEFEKTDMMVEQVTEGSSTIKNTNDATSHEGMKGQEQTETTAKTKNDDSVAATMENKMEQQQPQKESPLVSMITKELLTPSNEKESTGTAIQKTASSEKEPPIVDEPTKTQLNLSNKEPPVSAPLPKTLKPPPATTSHPPPPPISTSATITTTNAPITQVSPATVLPEESATTATTAAAAAATPASSSSSQETNQKILELEQKLKKSLLDVRDAQKESRTLRRHVVSLNTQLDTAENEIRAQRNELERAAERFEKDRTRHKQEKENLKLGHTKELQQLKQQHDTTLEEQKKRSTEQLDNARQQLQDMEQRRMQEGGDWTKELEEAVKREQQMAQRLTMMEDEKSTLLSQVSSLQAQQTTLEARLDSVSLTAENAMERETEAEDRLDKALSIHARQLSQRQTRESELERTVADLGAALVVARNREMNRLQRREGGEGNDHGMFTNASDASGGGQQGSGSGSGEPTSLKARVEAAEDELETVKAQLELERQRSETLQQELRDVTKERAEEVSVAHARQLQHDRRIADMSLTISRLELNLREMKEPSRKNSMLSSRGESTSSMEDDEKNKEINSLSEEILRQQQRMGKLTSETSALKSRLQVALGRAESAEHALELARQSNELDDSEGGNGLMIGGHDHPLRTRRRRGGGRRGRDSYGGSIRSAMRLGPEQGGDGKERIGKAVDALDKFSVQTGKFLRYNPLARGAFLVYLLLLHLWTFFLLFFHAHHFENLHGDFGAGRQMHHGPHAMMQQHEALSNPSP